MRTRHRRKRNRTNDRAAEGPHRHSQTPPRAIHKLASEPDCLRRTDGTRAGDHHVLDCTHTPHQCPRARRTRLAAISILLAALLAGALAGRARGDGDPASDVLLSQRLYLPQDAGVPPAQQAQLTALLAAARRSGYTLRVALIAGPADLGSVTELWHQPQNYAHFLSQELSLNYKGPLLVVMPNGYGLYQPHASSNDQASVLSALAPPGRNLGPGALGAIERLAAASGHNLPTPAATTATNSRSSNTTAWIVFGIGAIIIILAWAASLRARPPRLSGGRISSTRRSFDG